MCRFLIPYSNLEALCCHINFVGIHLYLGCPQSKVSNFGSSCATIIPSPFNRKWPQNITYIINNLTPLDCNWYTLRMDTKDFCNSHRRSWPCTNSSKNNNMFWSQFGIGINLLNFFQRFTRSSIICFCAMASLISST